MRTKKDTTDEPGWLSAARLRLDKEAAKKKGSTPRLVVDRPSSKRQQSKKKMPEKSLTLSQSSQSMPQLQSMIPQRKRETRLPAMPETVTTAEDEAMEATIKRLTKHEKPLVKAPSKAEVDDAEKAVARLEILETEKPETLETDDLARLRQSKDLVKRLQSILDESRERLATKREERMAALWKKQQEQMEAFYAQKADRSAVIIGTTKDDLDLIDENDPTSELGQYRARAKHLRQTFHDSCNKLKKKIQHEKLGTELRLRHELNLITPRLQDAIQDNDNDHPPAEGVEPLLTAENDDPSTENPEQSAL